MNKLNFLTRNCSVVLKVPRYNSNNVRHVRNPRYSICSKFYCSKTIRINNFIAGCILVVIGRLESSTTFQSTLPTSQQLLCLQESIKFSNRKCVVVVLIPYFISNFTIFNLTTKSIIYNVQLLTTLLIIATLFTIRTLLISSTTYYTL